MQAGPGQAISENAFSSGRGEWTLSQGSLRPLWPGVQNPVVDSGVLGSSGVLSLPDGLGPQEMSR